MATIIGLPKLSPTMEEGVLARWTKKEGDKISPGDVIAEVETDKANMDFSLEDEGTLLKLLAKEGDTVKLGAPVAILGEPGEDVSALLEQAKQGVAPPPEGAETARPAGQQPTAAEAPPVPPPEPKAPAPRAPEGRGGDGAGRVLASPMAKTLAADHGLDLRGVQGSGPGGRIVERDVRALMEQPAPGRPAPRAAAPALAPAPAAAPAPARAPGPTPLPRPAPAEPGQEFTEQSLSMMRRTIARRLVEAKTTIPHFYLTSDCDAAPLMAFRSSLNRIAGEGGKVSINDLVIKAAALALRRVPEVNASFEGDRLRFYGRVHIGVAIAVDDGLITAVLRDADQKGLATIAAEARDLAERARARRLHAAELGGSTFTVSNLGMFGIDHFEAIINPPEAAILAVGAVRKLPVVADGDQIVVGQRMALTLSCDHRVVDGALGARFLAELVKILEQPAALAL